MKRDEGYFSSKDNTRLYWQSVEPAAPKAWVAVVHGYGDHSGRYKNPMEALANAGYASQIGFYQLPTRPAHPRQSSKTSSAMPYCGIR